MSNTRKEGNLLMIIALFIFMGMQPTIISKSISLFMAPMYLVKGVSTTAFSTRIAISGLLAALLSPMTGKALNRFGVKKLMLVSGILNILSFWGLTLIDSGNTWLLYLNGIIGGISQLGISNVVVSTIVTSWYPGKKKGTMLGLVMAGSNAFNFLWVNVIGTALNTYGNEFYIKLMGILSVIMAAVSIPLILFVFRLNPEMDTTVQAGKNAEAVKDIPGMTMKEAQKMPIFWMFCLALAFMGIIITGIQMHVNAFLQLECGASAGEAARIWSIAAPCAVLSNILMGIAFTKFGARNTILVTGLMCTLCCVFLMMSVKNIRFAPAAVAFYGLSAAIATTAPAYLTNVMFGQKEYAKIYGFTMMVFLLGATLGSVITSIVANALGYASMWKADVVLCLITFGTFLYTIVKNKASIEANS